MLVLAIDTCDARGSVAVLRDGSVLALAVHEPGLNYSSWLLPAIADALSKSAVSFDELDGFAAASGPGSFTGVRVGLTTVKAWAEVYSKPVAAVSRLEAIASHGPEAAQRVAAFFNAQRGQLFGAVYQRHGSELQRIGDEMVIPPGKFVEEVGSLCKGEKVYWLSPDPAHLSSEAAWKESEARGESIESVSPTLAPAIGRIGARILAVGKAVDALTLDANYVRRSDAEIFWEGGAAAHGR